MRWLLIMLAVVANLAHARPDSVYLYNVTDNRMEYQRNSNETRAMASITKLMTAMVTLDHDKNLQRKIKLITPVKSNLPRQDYSRYDLLMAMLVRSDNAAAETLAADYPGGRRAFITAMNRQARQLDLRTVQFDDPSGLSSKNTGTAGDVANMVQIASGYWVIREASTRKDVEFETRYQKKIRKIKLNHTSGDLLFAFDSVIVSKTGLTNSAGWCVGMMVEQNQKQYVIVVLGSRTKQQRTTTAQDLLYNHIVDKNLQDPWKMQ